MKRIKIVGIILVALVAVLVAGIFLNQPSGKLDTGQGSITVGSKNFTESLILGEAYAQLLEDNGFSVKRSLNLGGTFVAQESLQKGDIDLYPEYTGTGILDILKKTGIKEEETKDVLNKEYAKWDLEWLDISKANNSQGLVVSKEVSEQYGIKTFSDLAKNADKIRFVAGAEFNGREDGLPGLQKAYGGFEFKSNQVVDAGLRYKSIENGDADATVAYTTDGQLTDERFVLLEDDKKFYPNYYVAPVVRKEVVEKNPKVAELLNSLSAKLSDKKLQELNAKVDLDGQEYKDVVKDFLKSENLIK